MGTKLICAGNAKVTRKTRTYSIVNSRKNPVAWHEPRRVSQHNLTNFVAFVFYPVGNWSWSFSDGVLVQRVVYKYANLAKVCPGWND